IVAENRELKVWNLSLGSALEIHKDYISNEAAILDKIQYDYDVIFFVAGTNKPSDSNRPMLIGAPADSKNSLIFNSV
ncbi:serine protease, partial [Streptococcus suis]